MSEGWFSKMNKYIPFLKLKPNEIMALKELETTSKQQLTPFFDFPYKKKRTEDEFKKTANDMILKINRYLKDVPYFYLDNFDVDSNLTIDGGNNYIYLLNACDGLFVVPVISIDRSSEHMQSVCNAKDNRHLISDRVALRFVEEDFNNFNVVADEIEELLADTFSKFTCIDLIIDCRICSDQNIDSLVSKITAFIKDFNSTYPISKAIVTGSSISASIGDILKTNNEVELPRVELYIFDKVSTQIGDDFNLVLGDYGIVSPDYSDLSIDPRLILSVTTSKFFYTFDRSHYVIRGGSLKKHKRGYGQYNDAAEIIVAKPFFRGSDYSFGDNFIEEKSRSIGSNVTPSTILKPTINSHVAYMLNGTIPSV